MRVDRDFGRGVDERVRHSIRLERLGYAIDRGEFADGVGGVCAAVTSSSGYEGLASFLGPLPKIEQIGFDALGRHLATLTARASRALGDPAQMRFFGTD